MKLIAKILSFVSICALSISADADSPIWASYKVECPSDSEVYLGIISTRASVFTGTVCYVKVTIKI